MRPFIGGGGGRWGGFTSMGGRGLEYPGCVKLGGEKKRNGRRKYMRN